MSGWSEKTFGSLLKRKWIAFRVFEGEAKSASFVFGDGACVDFVGEEIFAHLGEIRRGEGDISEEIVGRAAGNLLELHALATVDGVTGILHAEAGCGGGVESERFGVKVA